MASSAPAPSLTPIHVISRVAASLLGGWVFVWGLTVLGIALGVLLGADYHQMEALMYLLAFPVFLAVFCWAYVAASVSLVWLALAGGGALMTGAAWLIIPALSH